jgi:hypothetical protein
MSPTHPGHSSRGLIALLGLLFASPFVTISAQSSADAISACVGDNSRQVRFVGADEPCRNNETRVTFNVAGPPGPEGPQGPPGPAGPSGTTGQDSTSVFGIAPLISTGVFQVIPGLTQVVTVPEDSRIYVSTDGGVAVNSAVTGVSTVADVAIFVDGALVSDAAFRRVTATNVSAGGGIVGISNWSMARTLDLDPGPHTIDIRASRPGFSTTSATVSGDTTSVLQGQLTITILKQ